MTKGILEYFISSVFAAFNKPKANAEVRKHLSERLVDIPDEAVPWILEKIESDEKFPSNLALTAKRLWSSWLASHPDKRGADEQGNCPLGCDLGSFTAWKQERDGRWHQYGFDCPNCRPAGEHAADPRWLRQHGYRVQLKHESGCAVYAELTGRKYPRSNATNDWVARAKAASGKGREWDKDVNERTWRVEAQAGEGR